jgi:hypothetical protein
MPQPLGPATPRLLHAAGRSTLWTTGIVAVLLAGRMWGADDIEWKDRSWRLMANQGQLETDDWTYGGMLAGLGATTLLRRPLGWVGAVGAVGFGSFAGMMGYMTWRYAINKGKFPEDPDANSHSLTRKNPGQ